MTQTSEVTAEEEPEEVKAEEKPKEEKPEVKTFQVRTRSPEDKAKYLNILAHGDSGVGKTMFCGTMIKAGLKVLYIVLNEDELTTLDQAGITGYDYQVITNYGRQLWPLYLALRRNKPGYEGVVFDGLGDFQQAAKDYELAGGEGVGVKFMEEAMKGGRRMYLQNWGNLLEMTRHFLDPFLKLPMHKIITCISEADDDPKTGKTKIYPGLQGSLQQLIAAHFSVVGYSYIAHWAPNTYYCLTTQPHEALSTKDRTGLCRVLPNPQFKTFLDALEGKIPKLDELQEKLARALVLRPQATTITQKGGD
ncbi:hypothetical protein ES703_76032 [subsurface metagenome]